MSGQNQSLLYTAPVGAVKVEVFFKDETVSGKNDLTNTSGLSPRPKRHQIPNPDPQ